MSPARRAVLTALAAALSACGCPAPPAPDGGADASGGPLACANGADDDGDALADFPGDPGCTAPEDTDETDPLFPPVCANGLDDDFDGAIDFGADPGCAFAADGDETDPPVPPECANGLDDDGDAYIDYPTDPDCVGPDDGIEAAPPACANDTDDDEDGLTDFPLDSGCATPEDDDEWNPAPCGTPGAPVLELPPDGVGAGDIFGVSAFQGICGGGGAEVIYYVDPPGVLQELVVDSAGSLLDTAVYVRSICAAAFGEIGCSTSPAQARLVLRAPIDWPIWIFVDGRFSPDSGPYVLTVHGTLLAGSSCTPGDLIFECPVGATCTDVGAGPVCVAGACSNGVDDDADALVDLFEDPGCADAADPSETDVVPAPACANGADDDGDALADYPADPGCTIPGDDDELELCPGGVVPADLGAAGGADDGFTSGGSVSEGSCGGASSPEAVYYLDPPGPVSALTVTTAGSLYDTVLYLRSGACGAGAEIACADDGAGASAVLTGVTPPPGRIWIFVDGFAGAAGTYQLLATALLAPLSPCTPGDPVFDCDAPAGLACLESTAGAGDFACRPGVCADAADADGDGHASFPLDLGCTSAADTSEGPDPSCWNGMDDDGDAVADYPFECGCFTPTDMDESDPVSPAACCDGTDNDGDGAIDFPADLGCADARDDLELSDDCPGALVATDVTAPVLAAAPGEASFTGATSGASALSASCGGATAPEAVYAIRLTAAYSALSARTVSAGPASFDTILYVRDGGCTLGAELACSDDFPACCFSAVTHAPAFPGVYYFVVDGDGVAQGDYELRISLTP